MKRGSTIVIGVTSLIFIVSVLSVFPACQKKQPAPAPDWGIFNIKAWDEATYKLVPPPSEDGNAAGYFLKAIHYDPRRTDAGGLKSTYDWWNKFKTDDIKDMDPIGNNVLASALKIPELDIIVKGSMQKDYHWIGIYASPSPRPDATIFDYVIPSYMDIMRLCRILQARAIDKLAQGDRAGAEADMLATVRAGHILQQDITLIGMMVGFSIESAMAKDLPGFYRKAGDEAKAKAWEDFLPGIERRREAARAFIRYTQAAPSEELIKVADNRSLPRAARFEIVLMAVVNSMLNHPSTIITGVPRKIKKFLLADHYEDPEMVIVQLKLIEDVYVGQLSTIGGRIGLLAAQSRL